MKTIDAITVAGAAISIVGIFISMVFPKIPTKVAMGGFAIGMLLVFVAFMLPFLPGEGEAQSIQTIQYSPSVNGNCNAVGNNNSLCNSYGPQKLVFPEEAGNFLLSKLPDKKQVVMRAVGSPNDWQIADRFQAFLEKNGYQVSRVNIGMLLPPPDHKISLGVGPDHYELTIAPNAN